MEMDDSIMGEDDGQITSSEDEDMDDEATRAQKRRKPGSTNEFASGFHFDSGDSTTVQDDLNGLGRYLKKTVGSSLEEKIARVRRERQLERPILVNGDDATSNQREHEEEEPDQECVQVEDRLNEKKRTKKKTKDDFFDAPPASTNVDVAFADMNLSRPILKAISACGFSTPTPVQAACIPVALAGRDICACASTGTGKTAAFMLPILERLLYKPRRGAVTRVLVLVPTRELAIQVFQVSLQLAQFISADVCLCAGGLDVKAQEAALRQSPDIVIATPGRLIDHLHNAPNFSLHEIEVLVLDEADRMLDETFAEQMKELIRMCARQRQTMLFSATMTDQISDLAAMSLKRPVKLFINENTDTALNLRQEFIRIRENREVDREPIVAALVTRQFSQQTMVFVQTKRACHRLQIVLGLLGVRVAQLHGGLTQTQRVLALNAFKNHKVDVLCSTDLAARGLDIEGVRTVINLSMPISLKHYVHRVGRTARAGRAGRSISLVGESERKLLKEIAANARAPLKQRVIAPEVTRAYYERIQSFRDAIAGIEEEERIEREVRIAESKMNGAERKLQGESNAVSRVWFQSAKEKRAEKVKLKLGHKMGKKEEKEKVGAKKKKVERAIEGDDGGIARVAAFEAREAKRRRKPPRIRAMGDDDAKTTGTQRLTMVGKKALKRFRHGPSDADFKANKLDKTKARRRR